MIRELLQFIIGQISLQNYWCDKCQDVEAHHIYWNKVGLIGYLTRTKNGNHYCNNCWNYMRLAKGECPACHSKFTKRSWMQKVYHICEKDCLLIQLHRW